MLDNLKRSPGRVPFMPAIYEHKAWFIGETPSRVCRDTELLTRSLLAEYEQLQSDALTVGIDIYNVEAEALGCPVTYFDDSRVPLVEGHNPLVRGIEDLANFKIPNPLRDGRMPLHLQAVRRLGSELGGSVWIRGAVSGPCSLAMTLAGSDAFLMAIHLDPDFVRVLLDFAKEVILKYAEALIDSGVDVVIFDSQASPAMIPPAFFMQVIQPLICEIVSRLKAMGANHVPLIIGGDTTAIARSLSKTGADNLLCDYNADWPDWLELARAERRSIRRNLPPTLLDLDDPEQIHDRTLDVIGQSGEYEGYVQGTSIVPYGTPTARLLAVCRACRSGWINPE